MGKEVGKKENERSWREERAWRGGESISNGGEREQLMTDSFYRGENSLKDR